MKYPTTKRLEYTEEKFGHTITDPYRWLENGENTDVQKWTKIQNNLAKRTLSKFSIPSKYRKELEKVFNVTTFGLPRKCSESYFWNEKKGNENQAVLYYKKGITGKPIELVNPNKLDKSGLTSLDYWNVSKTGRYIAYGLSKSGDENSTLFIYDVNSKRILREIIPNCRYANPRWLPDESGFFYTKHPDPGTVPKGEEAYHQRVLFHKVGTKPKNDNVIFGQGRKMEDTYMVVISQDGDYLFIDAYSDWTKSEVYMLELKTGKVTTLVEGLKYRFHPSTIRDKVFLFTNYKANNFRVLIANLDHLPKKIDDWEEFITEERDVLQFIGTSADRFFAGYLKNACSVVKIYNLKGKYLNNLDIPPISTLGSISANRDDKEYFYGVSNFFCGNQTFRYNPRTNTFSEYRKSDLALYESDYKASQVWYKSKDGTKVPMFLFHKRSVKLNSKNPTILYGYGGFSHTSTPGFLSIWVPFLKRGGVFAIANIRGGAEFGEKWHKEGMLNRKMNTFDDFNSAAKKLIQLKLTNKNKLASFGGSNGGLLVAACMIMRPDLYKAVICRVPLLDMIRFPYFLMAKRWVYEYGDPDKKEDFESIIKWSPYHNVKKGKKYPSILFAIANKDTRVDPFHSRKMTALMQHKKKDNIVLLRTEMESGHGPGKSKQKMIEEQADILAFLEWQIAN